MDAKIVTEIDSLTTNFHLKIGFISILSVIIFFFILSYKTNIKYFSFFSSFNYIEGIEVGSDVSLAGIKIGKVSNIELIDNQVIVKSNIYSSHKIPADSIIIIRSNGIFGKKSLLIEPGFDEPIENNNFIFNNTKDSYSFDMFLRYLSNINE